MLSMSSWISDTFISIGIWIVSSIYEVVAYAFRIFMILADGKVVESASYENVVRNFYLVISVIMLFVLAFSILKAMVNPDDQKKGTEAVKKSVINLVTSSIILVLLPYIFTFGFDIQRAVLGQNTIGKLFGYESANTESGSGDGFIYETSNRITNSVFTAFFMPTPDVCPMTDIEDLKTCNISEDGMTFYATMEEVNQTGHFNRYNKFSPDVDDGKISFSFILSLIAGLLLIYVAVSYCFDMALRLVKLVFYQIIAPIPVFLRIVPEGKISGTFNSWVKVTLTCYLEVFVRIFVLYICFYLCNTLLTTGFLSKDVYQYGFFAGLYTKAFVLMGIITFMKQAPKLISEITGLDSGNMKLGIREKLAEGGAFTAGAVAGGLISTGVRNANRAFRNIRNNNFEVDAKTGKIKRDEHGKRIRKEGATNGKIFGSTLKGIGSTIAGATSGGYHAAKAGWNAKSASDMTKAASSGSSTALSNRDGRAGKYKRYKENNQNFITGHYNDFKEDFQSWYSSGSENYNNEINSIEAMLSTFDSIGSMSKGLLGKIGNNAGVTVDINSDMELDELAKFFKGNPELYSKVFKEHFKGATTIEQMKARLEEIKAMDANALVNKERFIDSDRYIAAQEEAVKSVDIGKYTDKVRYSEAQDAAAKSVDKSHFVNEERYNKAVAEARRKAEVEYTGDVRFKEEAIKKAGESVKIDDFVNEEEYIKAVERAKKSVNINNFIDTNAYNNAISIARSSILPDNYIKDAEYAKALQDKTAELDVIKAAASSIVGQLEKATTENTTAHVVGNPRGWNGASDTDISPIISQWTNLFTQLKNYGGGIVVNPENPSETFDLNDIQSKLSQQAPILVEGATAAQKLQYEQDYANYENQISQEYKKLKKVMDIMKLRGDQLKRDSAKARLKAQQRKDEKGSK